ncbi:MAG: hypothetical protein LBT86_05405 [Deltaproteobacteria bacterium]|jgi:flagellar biosynthesis/type III secretory pathway protein FliH|nr:hypothetical protein [Deltaproteobacteria bacterium]
MTEELNSVAEAKRLKLKKLQAQAKAWARAESCQCPRDELFSNRRETLEIEHERYYKEAYEEVYQQTCQTSDYKKDCQKAKNVGCEEEFKMGFEKGFKMGFKKGYQIGVKKSSIRIARILLGLKSPIDEIERLTGLSHSAILELTPLHPNE